MCYYGSWGMENETAKERCLFDMKTLLAAMEDSRQTDKQTDRRSKILDGRYVASLTM